MSFFHLKEECSPLTPHGNNHVRTFGENQVWTSIPVIFPSKRCKFWSTKVLLKGTTPKNFACLVLQKQSVVKYSCDGRNQTNSFGDWKAFAYPIVSIQISIDSKEQSGYGIKGTTDDLSIEGSFYLKNFNLIGKRAPNSGEYSNWSSIHIKVQILRCFWLSDF